MAAKRRPSSPAKSRAQVKASRPGKVERHGPLLSIGIIFRDDIRCLERCLQGMAPLRAAIPCELVMADTGSKDGSRQVAEKYADQLFDFPWINDFAAARNAVMDRSSGAWFFTVDTDEYLDPDIDRLARFFTGPEIDEYDLAFVTQRNYASKEMVAGECSNFYALRMINMSTGRRYAGSIHEGWPRTTQDREILLEVVLHHDGYADGISQKKKKRNLPMLERELAASPQEIRRVNQCLETSYTREQARRFSKMAIELVPQQPELLNSYGAVALRESVRMAYKFNFPEFIQWHALAVSLSPKSPYVCVDCSYMAADYYMNQGEYELCLYNLSNYQKGLKAYLSGKIPWKDLRWSTLSSAAITHRQSAAMLEIVACVKLERWGDALHLCEQFPLNEVNFMGLLGNYLVNLLAIWRKGGLDQAQELLARAWNALEQDTTSKLADERRRHFLLTGRALFTLPEDEADELPDRPPHRFFAGLGPSCDLGQAGLALEIEQQDELHATLASVKDWQFIPPQIVNHTLHLNAPLPDSFFQMDCEHMETLSKGLIELNKERPEQPALGWAEQLDISAPGQLMWLYDLTIAAILGLNWKESPSLPLCELYHTMTLSYLNTFYPPSLITPEYLHLLPPALRFGWHYLHAHASLQDNDLPGYIRNLRAGLKTAPFLKDMVKFLSEREEIQQALKQPVSPQDEMRQLAQAIRDKVNLLRAQGSPLADEIEKSPQYQQLLPLIEQL